MPSEPKLTITVCDACLQACCWHGIFYCDEYECAGTVEKTIEELRTLNLEHPQYWELEQRDTKGASDAR